MLWCAMVGMFLVSMVSHVESIPFDEMSKEDKFVPLEHTSDENFVFHTTGIVRNLPDSSPPPSSTEGQENDGTLVIEREGTDVRPSLSKVLRGKSAFSPCQDSNCGNVVSTGYAKTGTFSGNGKDDSPPSDNVVRID